MRTLRLLTIVSLTALASACNDSSSAELDLRSFSTRSAETICSALATCECTDPSATADCTTVYSEWLLYTLAEELIGSPAIRLDPPAAETCLSDMSASLHTCSAPDASTFSGVSKYRSRPPALFDLPSCTLSRLFVGTQSESEFCADSMSCAPGLACDYVAAQCITPPTSEESCADVSGCEEGHYCDESDTCVAYATANEDCTSTQCADGLTCVSATSKCTAPHALTEDCTDGAGCVAGAYCGTGGVCQAFVADGGDCSGGKLCLHDSCNASNVCENPGLCSALNYR